VNRPAGDGEGKLAFEDVKHLVFVANSSLPANAEVVADHWPIQNLRRPLREATVLRTSTGQTT